MSTRVAAPQPLDELLADASARTDDELVTRALSRDVQLPLGAGTMALITLDNGRDHTKPNTFGPRGLGGRPPRSRPRWRGPRSWRSASPASRSSWRRGPT